LQEQNHSNHDSKLKQRESGYRTDWSKQQLDHAHGRFSISGLSPHSNLPFGLQKHNERSALVSSQLETSCLAPRPALQCGMPTLTRRRSVDHRYKCWHIYYGDVPVGTIAERVGNPHDTDPWEWSCGFYPGSHPGEHQSDTTATFEEARADFERTWLVFLSKRTKADFQAWRDQKSSRPSRLAL